MAKFSVGINKTVGGVNTANVLVILEASATDQVIIGYIIDPQGGNAPTTWNADGINASPDNSLKPNMVKQTYAFPIVAAESPVLPQGATEFLKARAGLPIQVTFFG